ncbi:hypothetical protein C8J57DRAFT_1078763 [Mycena rebaudengoi]|nr:hypothetical protein C8J57DRAFT_1078763 [Mycena rebaudengoi]
MDDINQPNGQCLCSASTAPSAISNRRLVVAFDGTENKFGPHSSHVVEFYSRIVKSGDQPSYYTSGIGTYVKQSRTTKRVRTFFKNKWASITAWNFKSNLFAGYQWLSENYQPGDQIFLLGFSRGAYQVRVLAAMVTRVGLIRTGNKEQIPFAFDVYRDPNSYVEISLPSQVLAPSMISPPLMIHFSNRNIFGDGPTVTTAAKEFKKAFCDDVSIHFVGVWDTVSSVGLFHNKQFPGAQSAENICFFRHALALDERRVKFLPEYVLAPREWFQMGEFGLPRCKEVWFRGCHSDVGGGNTDNITSDNGAVSSRWMAYEAMLAGLEMTPFQKSLALHDLTGNPPTDSMNGFYKLFEYVPLVPPIKWVDLSVSPLVTTIGDTPDRKFKRCGSFRLH